MFNVNIQKILAGLVIGIILGGSVSYFIFSNDSNTQTELLELNNLNEALTSQIDTLQGQVADLSNQLEDSAGELEIVKNNYEELFTETRSLRMRFDYDIEKMVENLMKPKSEHSWEDGYYNPDLQVLYILQPNDRWGDSLYKEINAEYEKQGGVTFQIRYSEISISYLRYIVQMLSGEGGPMGIELVETFGLEHIGILYLGDGGILLTMEEVFNRPYNEILRQIYWVQPDTSELGYRYILNPPY